MPFNTDFFAKFNSFNVQGNFSLLLSNISYFIFNKKSLQFLLFIYNCYHLV